MALRYIEKTIMGLATFTPEEAKAENQKLVGGFREIQEHRDALEATLAQTARFGFQKGLPHDLVRDNVLNEVEHFKTDPNFPKDALLRNDAVDKIILAAQVEHLERQMRFGSQGGNGKASNIEPIRESEPLDIFSGLGFTTTDNITEMIPKVIADYAVDRSKTVGASVPMFAIPCLSVAAAVLHDGITIQPREHDPTWTESSRLWVAGIDESGGKKSPALKSAVQVIQDIDFDWALEDESTLKEYEYQRRIYEKKVEEAAKASAKGTQEPLPSEPVKPVVRRRVVSDITIEALRNVLENVDSGVLCVHDELASFFGGMDAYRGNTAIPKDRGDWLAAFNGGNHLVDRVGKRYCIPNWSVGIVGFIQPDPMRKIAEKITDDGLLARFWVFFGTGAEVGKDVPIDQAAHDAYKNTIRALANMVPEKDESPCVLSPEAMTCKRKVCNLFEELKLHPEVSVPFRSWLAKIESNFCRLLLTFHALNCAVEIPGKISKIIPGETARQVERLVTDFLLPSASRFYSDLIGSEFFGHAKWVAGYILSKKSERISFRDISRNYRALKDDRMGINRSMDLLELAGWVTARQPKPGKATIHWEVNSRVHEVFAERAEEERERREIERKRIAEVVRKFRPEAER